jgi:site-specific DNA-methyltransferase (adenine-specific)
MKAMPDSFVDLTITSPPYDSLRIYNGYSFDFESVAKSLFKIIKPGGVLVWIVGDETLKGSETGTSFRQALGLKEAGFNLHDTMIWRKTNPMPKFKHKRYSDVFEYMFVLSKGQPKTFNPLMQPSKRAGELYDYTAKLKTTGKVRQKKTFNINSEKYRDNIWEIAVARNTTEHPAIFPESLVSDHIISWSNEGDIVYDPFIGSGTTALAAKKLNRSYIGSEISKEYCALAESRI